MKKHLAILLIVCTALVCASAGLGARALSATPEATAASTQSAVSPATRVLMGYFAGWGALDVAKIPADKLTHILYAFSDLNADGQCAVMDNNAAPHMAAFKALKQSYPQLKVLISVGGWTNSGNFSANAKTADQRSALAKSCIDLWINGKGLSGPGVIDGIDIDWEFPGSEGDTKNFAPEDKQNFVALMQEFRKQLDALGKDTGTTYSLSAALNPDADRIDAGYDLSALANVLDYFNLMTYDFHGSWEATGPTDFHANLYTDVSRPSYNSMDASVKRFLAAGVPASKIVVGVPFYGHGWTGVDSANNGLYQPATGVLNDDDLMYSNIKAKYAGNSAYKLYRSDAAHAPWLYSASDKTFIAYDDPQTAKEKGQYAADNHLAGAMFWELTQDDDTFTLTSALCSGLNMSAAGRTC